jgi:uncharacterized protein
MPDASPVHSRPVTFEMLEQTLPRFRDLVDGFLGQLGLDITDLFVDHIGLRVNSREGAEQLRAELAQRGTELPVVEVHGRPICVFELQAPLQFGAHPIPCIELPFPGSRPYPQEGWQHVEIVLPGNAQSVPELIRLFGERFPHVSLETSPLANVSFETAAGPKGEKPSHTITFEHPSGFSVKFHHKALRDIRLET